MSTSAVDKTCETIEKTLGKSPAFRKVDRLLWVVKQGSAYVMVSVLPSDKRPDLPLVRIYAQVVLGVRPEPALLKQLLIMNGRLRFGAFAYVPEGQLILFTHTILGGGHLDSQELLSTVHDVALVADTYDDRIVAHFGGQRMQDVLEEAALEHLLGVREDENDQVIWDEVN